MLLFDHNNDNNYFEVFYIIVQFFKKIYYRTESFSWRNLLQFYLLYLQFYLLYLQFYLLYLQFYLLYLQFYLLYLQFYLLYINKIEIV
jgi:hypothetical protein